MKRFLFFIGFLFLWHGQASANPPGYALVFTVKRDFHARPAESGQPQCFLLGQDDNLYLVDIASCQIEKYDSKGKLVWKVGSKGRGEGQFLEPSLIAEAPDRTLLVVDMAQYRIEKYSPDGKFLSHFHTWTGYFQHEPGEIAGIYGMAFDSQGNVIIPDRLQCRIHKFDKNGKFLRFLDRTDGLVSTGEEPFAVVVDAQDNFYYTDVQHHHVYKADKNGKNWQMWGDYGTTPGLFVSPSQIAIDPAGKIWVLSWTGPLQVFTPSGKLLAQHSMTYTSMDPKANFFLSDPKKGTVEVYKPKVPAPKTSPAK